MTPTPGNLGRERAARQIAALTRSKLSLHRLLSWLGQRRPSTSTSKPSTIELDGYREFPVAVAPYPSASRSGAKRSASMSGRYDSVVSRADAPRNLGVELRVTH